MYHLLGGKLSVIPVHTGHQDKSQRSGGVNQGDPNVCESPPLPPTQVWIEMCAASQTSEVRWLGISVE